MSCDQQGDLPYGHWAGDPPVPPAREDNVLLHHAQFQRVTWSIHQYWAQYLGIEPSAYAATLAQENMDLRAELERMRRGAGATI